MKLRFDIRQNTNEWFAIKVGKFSASIASDLLMDKKTAGYKKLIDRLVEERITGSVAESKRFTGNQFTERGHEYEPIARDNYCKESFIDVEQVGVIEKDDWVLCSPDGLIGNNGLIQIKCPIFNTQRKYLKTKKVPTDYYKQMQFELFVSEREFNIFYSYHPQLPPVEIKVLRDNEVISNIANRIEEAKHEIEQEIKLIKSFI